MIELAALAQVVFAAVRLDTIVLPDGSKAGLWIPKSRKPVPLVVWFHGGIGANNPAKGVPAASNMASTWADSGRFALVAPSAWPASPWWTPEAAHRTGAAIDSALARKGVDKKRVIFAGASDGGTGALWLAGALRKPLGARLKGVAVWSCNPGILQNQGISLDEASLVGLPVRWTAGGRDHLYPLDGVRTWWTRFQRLGIPLQTQELPEADHDLAFHGKDLALFPAWVVTPGK